MKKKMNCRTLGLRSFGDHGKKTPSSSSLCREGNTGQETRKQLTCLIKCIPKKCSLTPYYTTRYLLCNGRPVSYRKNPVIQIFTTNCNLSLHV
jgi:hypothetical protein